VKKSNGKAKKGIEFLKTGIKGFDEVFGAGIPKGRALLITGSAGSGKTVLINNFLYHGITELNENGVFVTFEESPDDIARNVSGFGWDYESLIRQNKLAFVDVSLEQDVGRAIETGDYDLSPLIERIKYAVKKVKAKRLVIDSISSLFGKFQNQNIIRDTLARIYQEIKKIGVTTLITGEKRSGDPAVSRYGMEEFVVDGAIELSLKFGQQKVIQELNIIKIRGTGFRSGKVEFEITNHGIEIFPKIIIDSYIAKTDFKTRKPFDLPKLDAAHGGGIPQGQTCLISGNTGAGKTTLALHFLNEGFKTEQNAVFVALEEEPLEIIKMAQEHKMDLGKFERQGKLTFVSPGSLIDVSNDKLLLQIIKAVEATNAKRVVFDSISSLMSATMSEEQVRQFLLQLTASFKARGVTCLMTYLMGNTFGAETGQLLGSIETNLMRLSSFIDGIILLRYAEREQAVRKLLNILKLRGSFHSRDILQYEITDSGIEVGDKFER